MNCDLAGVRCVAVCWMLYHHTFTARASDAAAGHKIKINFVLILLNEHFICRAQLNKPEMSTFA